MKFSSAGICLLLAVPVLAQEDPTAGLEGIERARALAELTNAHRSDDPGAAIAYGGEALEFFGAHPDPELEAATLSHMAWAYMIRDDYEQAIAHAERAKAKAEQHDDLTGMSLALNNLGVIARRRAIPRPRSITSSNRSSSDAVWATRHRSPAR